MKKHKVAIYIIIILLLYIFTYSTIKFTNNMYIKTEDKPLEIWENQVCNIKADHCDLNLDGFNLSLAFNPKILTYKHPVNIELSLTADNYTEVTAEFIGKTMSMGLFPFKLKLVHLTGIEYKFSGIGSIVFCTTDPNMEWMLQLRITSANKIYQLAIELTTS